MSLINKLTKNVKTKKFYFVFILFIISGLWLNIYTKYDHFSLLMLLTVCIFFICITAFKKFNKNIRSVFEDDEKRKTKAGKIDIDKIVSVVASSYSLTESQLKSKVRTRQIALARQIAMYLSRTILNSPYQVIGRVFGKDHTTVLSNVSKIEKESKENPSLRKALDNLTNQIKATE